MDVPGEEKEVVKRQSNYGCPFGWSRFGDRCFIFMSTGRGWADSEMRCVNHGGNLASVHNSQEYYFIQDLVRRHSEKFLQAWLGGSDAVMEGTWLWSDGRRFGYTNWHDGEPNNARGCQHCLVMNYGALRQWDDECCWIKFPSICAKNLACP